MDTQNIIFIPAVVSNKGERKLRNNSLIKDVFELSISSWKAFADKYNCKVVVMDTPLMDTNITSLAWQRYYALDMLDQSQIEYNQVLIVDADTIVHPKCPNFFELTENKYVGVHDCISYDWIIKSIECYKSYLFNNFDLDIWKYINGGFQIFNKSHSEYLDTFKQFYIDNKDIIYQIETKVGLGTDQTPMNYFLQKYNVDVKILPYEYNMTGLYVGEGLSDDLPFIDLGYIYHFNGIPNNPESVLNWMQKVTDKIF
jgi:hypothetical protein